MSENACKVESTVGTSTTGMAFCRSSKLENAADLRSAQGSLRVGSIPTSGIVPVEHGWFMHRPCKSEFPDSNSGTGLSAERKLRRGYMTMPLDGRGCTNQTNWAYGVVNHPEPLLTVRPRFESGYARYVGNRKKSK